MNNRQILSCGLETQKEFSMKNKNLWLAILALVLVFGFVACGDGSNKDPDDPNNPNNPFNPGKPDATFDSIDAFETWLNKQSQNTPATAYIVKLNVSDLGATTTNGNELSDIFYRGLNFYIYLDLSGSTITTIPDYTFRDAELTGITIPNSVTSIGDWAFFQCTSLTNVTIPNIKKTARFT